MYIRLLIKCAVLSYLLTAKIPNNIFIFIICRLCAWWSRYNPCLTAGTDSAESSGNNEDPLFHLFHPLFFVVPILAPGIYRAPLFLPCPTSFSATGLVALGDSAPIQKRNARNNEIALEAREALTHKEHITSRLWRWSSSIRRTIRSRSGRRWLSRKLIPFASLKKIYLNLIDVNILNITFPYLLSDLGSLYFADVMCVEMRV